MVYTDNQINKCRGDELLTLKALVKNPALLSDYPLDEGDFTGEYLLVFKALKSLFKAGYKIIGKSILRSEYDRMFAMKHGCYPIEGTLSASRSAIDCLYNDTDEYASYYFFASENIGVYYADVKKHRLLRDAMRQGVDVSAFYVPDSPKEDIAADCQRRLLLSHSSIVEVREALLIKPPLFRKAKARSTELEASNN